MKNSGPFHNGRDALNASLYHQRGRPKNTDEIVTAVNLADLATALSGIELGTYDQRIIEWLVGYEPSTVAVVCGLIRRARATGIEPADARTILAALDEAADYKRARAANCADCEDQSCGTCQYRLRSARAYDSAADRLLAKGQPGRPPPPDHQPTPDGLRHIHGQHHARQGSEAGR
jgi:hypothetical protein